MFNILNPLLDSLALLVLLFASMWDLRTREIPDFLDYGLILFAFLFNASISIVFHTPSFIVNSLCGFLLFFIISLLLFYTGQWGGGDSKLLIGLATLIGLPVLPYSSLSNIFVRLLNSFISNFLVNLLFVGALYGLAFTIYLLFKHKKKFLKELSLGKKKYTLLNRILSIVGFVFLIPLILITVLHKEVELGSYFVVLMVLTSLVIFAWVTLWTNIFVKAVELASLYKRISPEKLTEGDWIAKDVYDNNKHIVGPKDLGINDTQIKKLIKLKKTKKLKYVMVREGIPFIPSFFLAYLFTLIIKTNFLVILLRILGAS